MSYPPYQHPGGHYPPPQQAYGAPPPPGACGAPPPQAAYGAPPPHGAYGAPPPGAYGQPAYGAHPHAAPPMPLYNGIPIPAPPPNQPSPPPPGYNALADVEAIRKATKGFGTDEKLLISTLAPLDAFQVDAVSKQFKMAAGKDLVSVIEKETSGYFEYALRLKALGPVAGDCWLLTRACQGAGTHEDLLNEVLLSRTNQDIWTLKQAFRAIYNKDLEKVVEAELSMKTRRMFAMALQGARMEDSVPVDPNAVEADVTALKGAARGAGTDEITICSILVSRSAPHLAAVARSYAARHREPLSAMIASEFSGHMLDALLYISHGAQGHGMGIERDAKLLEESMAGMGTKDERLAYRIIRMHWNRTRFEEVKRAYAGICSKKGLKARVEGETSGDFKRFLSAVVG